MLKLANIFQLIEPEDRRFFDRVQHEQLTILFTEAAPWVIYMAPLYASIIAWGVWTPEHAPGLLGWLSLQVVLSIHWDRMITRYHKEGQTAAAAKRALRVLTPSLIVTGTIWGGIASFHPDFSEPENMLFISLMVLAINVAPLVSASTLPRLYFGFMLPCLSQLMVANLISDAESRTWYPILIAWIMVGYSVFALLMFRNNYRSMALQFRNEELIEQLKVEKRIAERASAAKTRFLASASHDLRQPLQAQQMFIDILGKRCTDPDLIQLTERIQSTNTSLNELLLGLLDLSKLDADVVKPEFQSLELKEVFERLDVEQSAAAAAKGLRLKILTPDVFIRTDPVMFYSLISNLLTNALKYSDTGWVLLASRTRNDESGAVRIEIRDTGIGIPPTERSRIFEEFYQVNNAERDRRKGLGLGLSIVKRSADKLGIVIQLDAERRRGTRFILNVPRGEVVPTDQAMPTIEAFETALTVLVIDDDPIVAEAIGALLSEWGHTPVIATDEESAIVAVEAQGELPDLILCDFRLANNKNGTEVIKHLRRHYGDEINAIIITGDTSPERVKMLHESGIPVLHKPAKPAELRSLILSFRW